jgi:CSLREA domain-containing protein
MVAITNRYLPVVAGVALMLVCAAAQAAVVTVSTAADDINPNNGSVSLREAITAVNAGSDLGDPDITAHSSGAFGMNDTIEFDIPGAGVHTINLGTDASAMNIPLPPVTRPVVIDGYTQGMARPNTLAVGNNAVLLIEINGQDAGQPVGGLLEIRGGNSRIKGLVINRAQGGNSAALNLLTGGDNTVTGNFIGLDPTGLIGLANNCQGLGISGSSGNVIGGTDPGDWGRRQESSSSTEADSLLRPATSSAVPPRRHATSFRVTATASP